MSEAPRAPTQLDRQVALDELLSTAGPLLLDGLYRATMPGDTVRLRAASPPRGVSDDARDRLVDLLAGAGFVDVAVQPGRRTIVVRARRSRSLADTVDASMRLLVCGLNPSLHAADAGVGYAGPSNRFWPVMADVFGATPLDARALLEDHRIGMTDLVKRATPSAAELTAAEYRTGHARVRRLARWLQPGAVCFVGLTGYRTAVDRTATTGPQTTPIGSRPVYLMPSTSGRNAHATRSGLAGHLRAALRLADSCLLG